MDNKHNREIVFGVEVFLSLLVAFIIEYIFIINVDIVRGNLICSILITLICSITSILILATLHTKKYLASKEFNQLHMYVLNKLNIYNENLKEYNKNSIDFKRVERGNLTKIVSLSVVKNAEQNIFKYICKYFNIANEEETVEFLENYLCIISNLETYKYKLNQINKDIVDYINRNVPIVVLLINRHKIYDKLNFEEKDISINFDHYTLKYISKAGRSTKTVSLTLDSYNVKKFIYYIDKIVKSESFSKRQRKMMTNTLREKIKARDNYTCKICGKSQLLDSSVILEVDHIIRVSKGGKTVEGNLQTLCMKCNRHKSNKIYGG